MKYAWKEIVEVEQVELFDETGAPFDPPQYETVETPTNSGPVVGLNKGAHGDEKEDVVDPVNLTEGMAHDRYSVVNGKFQVKTPEELSILDKENSYLKKLSEVDLKNSEMNLRDFVYSGNSYVSDQNSIQGTQNTINGSLAMGTKSLSDPCPSPNGVWKTNDLQEDGVTPIYVSFNNGEFLAFAEAYFKRASDNFGVKEFHKGNLRALLIDPSKTVEDIENYDYSQGWL